VTTIRPLEGYCVGDNRIRELAKENDMKEAQLARLIGVSEARLRRWARPQDRVNVPYEMAMKIGDVFGVSTEYVSGADVPPEQSSVASRNVGNIPVYGKAAAGEGEIALAETPIDYIDKPAYLQGVDDCYAIMIVGESMEPRLFPGEVCIVHPYRPVRNGDYAVVQFQRGGEIYAVAKRLVAKTEAGVTLAQHNPAKEIEIANTDLVAIHYIKAIRTI